jgi:hypothetical protein
MREMKDQTVLKELESKLEKMVKIDFDNVYIIVNDALKKFVKVNGLKNVKIDVERKITANGRTMVLIVKNGPIKLFKTFINKRSYPNLEKYKIIRLCTKATDYLYKNAKKN